MEVLPVPNQYNFGNEKGNVWSLGSSPSSAEIAQLSRRLEAELRAAKSELSCAEVLLPASLLARVAQDALTLADCEPCGARGCTLFIQLEGQSAQELRRIATVKLDDSTVSTFELHLTLKHDNGSWPNLLLQFFKNLARGGTIVISPQYTLTKKKLYRSYQQD